MTGLQSTVARILGVVAAVVRGVAAVIAAVILVYAVFVLFGANPVNGLVTVTRGVYSDFGRFTQDLFLTSDPRYGQAIDIGLAALIWVVAGSVVSRLVLRLAPSGSSSGRKVKAS